MLILPNLLPIRRRKRGAIHPPIPSGPLVPVSATVVSYEGTEMTVVVAFDNTPDDPIVDLGPAMPEAWTAAFDGVAFVGSGGVVQETFNSVRIEMASTGAAGGEHVISYSGGGEIVTASGRALGVVVDFPLSAE